jgi:hypothetical protein
MLGSNGFKKRQALFIHFFGLIKLVSDAANVSQEAACGCHSAFVVKHFFYF